MLVVWTNTNIRINIEFYYKLCLHFSCWVNLVVRELSFKDTVCPSFNTVDHGFAIVFQSVAPCRYSGSPRVINLFWSMIHYSSWISYLFSSWDLIFMDPIFDQKRLFISSPCPPVTHRETPISTQEELIHMYAILHHKWIHCHWSLSRLYHSLTHISDHLRSPESPSRGRSPIAHKIS